MSNSQYPIQRPAVYLHSTVTRKIEMMTCSPFSHWHKPNPQSRSDQGHTCIQFVIRSSAAVGELAADACELFERVNKNEQITVEWWQKCILLTWCNCNSRVASLSTTLTCCEYFTLPYREKSWCDDWGIILPQESHINAVCTLFSRA